MLVLVPTLGPVLALMPVLMLMPVLAPALQRRVR
jgi:hypothetical protein